MTALEVVLLDLDGKKFPNLALMKLAAWHRAQGYGVSTEVKPGVLTYASKVFTFTPEPELPEATLRGGTGFIGDMSPTYIDLLPDEIEHISPDYGFAGIDYSLGFLTRGCSRSCEWCFVPEKEGPIRPHADITEFLQHGEVVLMDNNILASDYGIDQIDKLIKLGVKVDFNQGLDARLIDDQIARRLAALKWRAPIRLACDHSRQIESIRKAVELLRWHNATPSRYFCYLLVKDVDDAVERVRFLKSIYVDPFAQPFLDRDGTPPTAIQKHFSRWVNNKAQFKTQTWDEYRARKEGTP